MAGSGPVVLVVDDDSGIRLLCRVSLELEGFRVVEAAGLAGARAALAAGPVAAVLLDLMLRGEDGAELLAGPRDYGVVLLTGVDDPPAGADAVVRKPFDPDELVAAVRAAAR